MRFLILLIGLCLGLCACSTDTGSGNSRNPGITGTNPFANSGGSGGAATGAAGANWSGNPTAGTGSIAGTGAAGGGAMISGESCGGEAYEGQAARLDIYIIMDESASMIFPIDIWGPVTMALNQFFTSPEAAGIGAGIQFFSGGCDAAAYATPAVAVAPLPDNAQALANMMAMRLPGPGTATTPALQGAIMHARSRAMANPDTKNVVLLVTDGEPASCGATVESTAAAAAEGFSGTPSIPTYVLGLGNVAGLDQMAQGGGTGTAFVVSDPGSVQAVVDAMNSIRSQALPCEYAIPESTAAFDKNLVNLRWDSGGQTSLVTFVQSPDRCDAAVGGWFYDNDAAPSRLIACEATCTGLKSGGRVEVVLGCPQVGPD